MILSKEPPSLYLVARAKSYVVEIQRVLTTDNAKIIVRQ